MLTEKKNKIKALVAAALVGVAAMLHALGYVELADTIRAISTALGFGG